VLVLSTSNAAVDAAMRAVLGQSEPGERERLLRLGTSLDPEVSLITLGRKVVARAPALARSAEQAQAALRGVRERLRNRSLTDEERQTLCATAARCEQQIEEFNCRLCSAAPGLVADALVTGCTLARMVLDESLRHQRFDVVILDGASMASFAYAFAASLLAMSHLVYAGDPKQLPPIVQSEGRAAARWFGQNIYDWFGADPDDQASATALRLLRTHSHHESAGTPGPGLDLLRRLDASRKLLVMPGAENGAGVDDVIVRQPTRMDNPAVFVGGGHVALPHRGRWVVVKSPNASRLVWRVGFSHLAGDEVDPVEARRFVCPVCATGELALRRMYGQGWFIACTNGHHRECHYRRRLPLNDAKLKVRLQGTRCGRGHPLTARQGPSGIFLGCENYPRCKARASLALLEGV
jgi:hypothetical protein